MDRNCALESSRILKFSSIVFLPVKVQRLNSPDRINSKVSSLKEDTAKRSTYNFWLGGCCEVWAWLDQVRMTGYFKGRVRHHLCKQQVTVFIEKQSLSNVLRLALHAVIYSILW